MGSKKRVKGQTPGVSDSITKSPLSRIKYIHFQNFKTWFKILCFKKDLLELFCMQRNSENNDQKKKKKKNLSSHGGFESSHISRLILSTRRKADHSDRHSTDFIWPLPIFFCVYNLIFAYFSQGFFFPQWIINCSLCQFSMTIEFCRNLPTLKLSICKKWFGTYSAFLAILKLSKSIWDLSLKTQLGITINPSYTFLVTLSFFSFQPILQVAAES